MAEPRAPLTPDAAIRDANAAIAAVKAIKPKTPDEERSRSIELLRLNETLISASRQVVSDAISKRVNGTDNKSSKRGTGLSDGTLTALAKGIVDYVKPLIDDIDKRLAAIEAERVALKAELADCLKDAGVWKSDQAYRKGDVVSHTGVLWSCREIGQGNKPGTGSQWRMMHKSRP